MLNPPQTAIIYYDVDDPQNAVIKPGDPVYAATKTGPRMGKVISHDKETGCVLVEFAPRIDEEQ